MTGQRSRAGRYWVGSMVNRWSAVGCQSGRTGSALREAGFAQAKNLRGGILRWIDVVDPTLPKY